MIDNVLNNGSVPKGSLYWTRLVFLIKWDFLTNIMSNFENQDTCIMARPIAEKLFERACNSIVGGVNSPVRAFKAVETTPLFIKNGKGAYLYDVDGKSYIDFMMSWGAVMLGHGDDEITKAISQTAANGTSFGLSTELELELAELVRTAFPSIELMRMVNSGTEAVMSAIRLARGYTGRDKIIKFEGCYHGHSDGLLSKAGSGLATLGIPASQGVPKSVAADTLTADYNDLGSVYKLFENNIGEIACVIVEPIAGNMGVIAPKSCVLQALRKMCNDHGALLIFDEVITGFRVAMGGGQQLYEVRPDITTLGKIIGGGLPCGAFGGSEEIMKELAPMGSVYQAGTLSGNPLVCAAGITVLSKLIKERPYEKLHTKANEFTAELKGIARNKNIPIQINNVGPMFTMFFTEDEVYNFETANKTDRKLYAKLFSELLEEGVIIAPSALEAGFLSMCHLEDGILEEALERFKRAFDKL